MKQNSREEENKYVIGYTIINLKLFSISLSLSKKKKKKKRNKSAPYQGKILFCTKENSNWVFICFLK